MKRRPKSSGTTVNVIRIDSSAPDPTDLRRAVETLGEKGVLVFPTSGLYGLGADALSAEAVHRVFAIKRRPAHQPLLVLLSAVDDMAKVVPTIPGYAEPLIRLWPGGITLIFKAGDWVPAVLTGGTGTIGVRLPAHPVAKALVDQFGGPITGTSANLTGRPAAASVSDIDPDIRRTVDLVLDAGTLAGGSGSSIVDVTRWPVRVVREGAVPRQAIDTAMRQG